VVLCARYDGLVDFDRHSAAAHLEPFEQRRQTGVALDCVVLAVELNREARRDSGHRKSRFPDFGQAALGGTAIVPPFSRGRTAASLRRHYPDQVRGVYFSQCALRARTPPANCVHITWAQECQKTETTGIIKRVRSENYKGGFNHRCKSRTGRPWPR